MIDYKRAGRLEGAALDSVISDYWRTGVHEDHPTVQALEIEGKRATARCRMASFYTPTDPPGFHLNSASMLGLLAHATIAHAHYLSSLDTKVSEALLTHINLTCSKLVSNPAEIMLKVQLYARSVVDPSGTRKRPRSFLSWRFEFENDAAWGDLTVAFSFA
jgi:hypothetical protein